VAQQSKALHRSTRGVTIVVSHLAVIGRGELNMAHRALATPCGGLGASVVS
jgi:hypothetical protein